MRFPGTFSLWRLAEIAIFCSVSSAVGAAPNYTIGPPMGLVGADSSEGLGINASGQVAGYSSIAGAKHAFLYSDGGTSDLGTLGGSSSVANAINATGQVVGSSSVANDSAVHAFLYSNGRMTDLGTLGGKNSEALAINDNGLIVGDADTGAVDDRGNAIHHAFLYAGGKMTDLGTLGPAILPLNSVATGINANGQIVGYSDVLALPPGPGTSTRHPFLYANGKMTDWIAAFSTIPAPNPTPLAINVSAAATGYISSGNTTGFLYSNGNVVTIPAFGGVGTSAGHALNSLGDVVGVTEFTPNFNHALLFTGDTSYDLNSVFDQSATITLLNAEGINDSGKILVQGTLTSGSGGTFAALLTPNANSQSSGGGCAAITPVSPGPIDPMLPAVTVVGLLGLIVRRRGSRLGSRFVQFVAAAHRQVSYS